MLQDLVVTEPIMTTEETCRRCGISCHPAVRVGQLRVVVPGVHCQFLAQGSDGRSHCTVYEKRFEVAPWCLSAEEAGRDHLLSRDCPYHEGRNDSEGKTRLHPRLLEKKIPEIARQILAEGVPRWVSSYGVENILRSAGYEILNTRLDENGFRRYQVSDIKPVPEFPVVSIDEEPCD